MSYSPRESTLSEEIEWPLTTPKRGKRKERRRAQKDRVYPVEPKIIALFEKPYNTVNHSYRDFSQVPSEVNWVGIPPSVTEMTFPQRLHWLLQHPVHSTNASWRSHGRAFQITVPNHLHVKGVYHDVFGCKNYAVFLSKLQSWGFKLITKGRDGNCWYHELFLRGLPHLTQFFGEPSDPRRRHPDEWNEPDFYAIGEKYPLTPVPIGRTVGVALV